MAGGGYTDIQEQIGAVRNPPRELSEMQQLLMRVPGETVEQEIARLGDVLQHVKKYRGAFNKALGEKDCGLLYQNISAMRESLAYIRLANPAKDYNQLNRAMALREEVLFRNIVYTLSLMKEEDKLVLLGHNRHLSGNIRKIKNAGASPSHSKNTDVAATFRSG